MSKSKIKSLIGEISNPFTVHDGLFASMEEAKYGLRGVLRAYFGDDSDTDDDYLFFKYARVRFEKNPELDLELDHRRRIVIFIVKEPQGENAEVLKSQIRKQLTLDYSVSASDMRSRAAMTIYKSLDSDAKRTIIESEKRHEKQTEDER